MPALDPSARTVLMEGAVIPAHPLALTPQRKLDERRQAALTRYYCDAGAGGVAVGVHTTQFAIREAKFGLFEPVLSLAIDTMQARERQTGRRLVRVAGICGGSAQAEREAALAKALGYDLGLASLSALRSASLEQLIEHCRQIAEIIPLFGFYLQPAVGGRILDYTFWREFFEIENVAAVKVAPFDRYATLDVARALADSGRQSEIALYTGNDDSIVVDLVADFNLPGAVSLRFVGGLLGHWAVWTRRAVELLDDIRRFRKTGDPSCAEILSRSAPITDCNAAFFDAANNFAGCIAGIHEVLRRQGLMAGRWTLDPHEDLSPGQLEEIDRVYASYPGLNDDEFVSENLSRWLR